MPHVPDLHAHDTHDRELIAAHAAGDLDGRDLATAAELLASCTGCAQLHADLRAIAAATATVPARPRTRDFRLTEADAARLRPGGWRRLAAAFAGPRLGFTAPLGGGLAALGLAGLLLTTVPGVLPGAGDAAAPQFGASATEAPRKETEPLAPQPSRDDRVHVTGEASPDVDDAELTDPAIPASSAAIGTREVLLAGSIVLVLLGGGILVLRTAAARGVRAR
jgi:hypothetical protein